MRAAVADPVHVRSGDVRQSLDVADDVRGQHAELGGECIGEVGQVVVIARMQHEHQRNADSRASG